MTKEIYSFERYLNVRSATGASFSPDGQHISFLTNITGVAEVWSVSIDQPNLQEPAWPRQLTFRGERVSGATFAPHADTLLVSGDIGGNERAQLFLLSADGSEFRALTEKPEVMHSFGGWSPDGERIVYNSNERDARFFDVYEMQVSTGECRLLLEQDGSNMPVRYSPDGKQVLVRRVESLSRNALILIDIDSGEARDLTPDLGEGAALHATPFWSADRKGLYLLCNRERDFLSLAYLDLATTELRYLSDIPWDVEALAVTRDGASLAMVINEDGISRLELFDVAQGWEQRHVLLAPTLPKSVVLDLAWSQDGAKLAITLSGADEPTDIWIWDMAGGHIQRATLSSTGGIPRASFVAPAVVRYPSFDGRDIPAFLYQPAGAQKNLPVVISVHGGPESQERPWFNPIYQYLVARGYAVLAPNVRGSTGYGYTYQSLDDVRKRMDSVADLKAAVEWLRESGIADPERIAVYGGSYGGFMVLAAVTTYPDLWAAAVDIVGIANFVTFLENTGPWRRKWREAEYGSLEQDRAFLEQISPIHAVDKITAPLFVVHGANDPRVPLGEAEQVVNALRQRNVPVEYLVFADEGHGLIKRDNRLKAYPAIADFLDSHVKGAAGK
ncbi:alpha/beta hydrolase family protein [Ktedonobacter racemifer]|uniref:Acyl-peptide hydrolase n=1 Tax=Ktedonobacter racemifer DSM 44963 TaxID=485913 RepID=D6TNW7_KTERA|nr:S9 family peptidase [Ktedonobacter racemifer]EFH85503.1 peptidase S9 prolyl oligopeptidase active site domain protein [Ktedonobacter racemifer DSM 44963]